MTNTVTIYQDETDPDTRLAWYDTDGQLRDLTGWTLTAEVVNRHSIIATKTTGITGGDGTGTSNVNIAWTTDELDDLDGTYMLRVVATSGSETAVFTVDTLGNLPKLKVITKPTTVG
jgi:hypothetical protein